MMLQSGIQPLTRFALLPLSTLSLLVLCAPAAITQPPIGLQGSYVGVTIDGNRAPESFQSFMRSGNQSLWILDQAVGQYRNSQMPNPQNGLMPAAPATGSQPQANSAPIGSQFQGRLDIPNNPLSLRGSVFLGNEARSVMPALTYDVPVGRTTNVYAGAGYNLVEIPGQQTPLGSQSGVVMTTGIESAIDQRIVIYGDAKLPMNGIAPNSNGVRFQFGAGYRF